jgi:hypothetical protein
MGKGSSGCLLPEKMGRMKREARGRVLRGSKRGGGETCAPLSEKRG